MLDTILAVMHTVTSGTQKIISPGVETGEPGILNVVIVMNQ